MPSRPRWGENGGYDAIITTKKGREALGTPGVIIVTNYIHGSEKLWNYIQHTPHYIAKHCENSDIITHIAEAGIVNRYGFLFTKESIDFNGKSIDVGSGWFTIKNTKTIEELIEYVDSLIA